VPVAVMQVALRVDPSGAVTSTVTGVWLAAPVTSTTRPVHPIRVHAPGPMMLHAGPARSVTSVAAMPKHRWKNCECLRPIPERYTALFSPTLEALMRTRARLVLVVAVTAIFAALGASPEAQSPAQTQTLSGDALIRALRQGGKVMVMRHASSPRQAPDKQTATADNVTLERQLDEAGRTNAAAMGNALRDLKIPIGSVLTSPTYRAMETIRLAKLPNPVAVPELGDGGQSMQGVTGASAVWLQKKVTEFPSGTITLLVTHMPNLAAAFPAVTGVADGEALVFGPDGKSGARLVARIKIEDWARMK
jgi:phosphohistidine phosphatase SixA